MPPPEIRRVSDEERRAIFNEHYLQGVLQGKFRVVIVERKPVERSWLPSGSFRIRASYYDNGQRLAFSVHFELADGSIAASLLPDPKWVWYDGVIYTE